MGARYPERLRTMMWRPHDKQSLVAIRLATAGQGAGRNSASWHIFKAS
jgi:hypothetical protein